MKKLFAMIMVICLVFGLVACGGNGDTAPETTEAKLISGTYVLCKADVSGDILEKDQLEEFGMIETTSITFNGDGTGIFRMDGEELDMKYDFEYIIDPYFEDESEKFSYELNDSILSVYLSEDQIFYYELAK